MKKFILLFTLLCASFASCETKEESEKDHVTFEGNPEAFAYSVWEYVNEYTVKIDDVVLKHKDIITMSFFEDAELSVKYSYTESGFETESKLRNHSIFSVNGNKLTLELVERDEIVETHVATIKGEEFSYTAVDEKSGKTQTYLFRLKSDQ